MDALPSFLRSLVAPYDGVPAGTVQSSCVICYVQEMSLRGTSLRHCVHLRLDLLADRFHREPECLGGRVDRSVRSGNVSARAERITGSLC